MPALPPADRWPASPHPFLWHEWLSLWWRHFGAGKELFVADLTGAGGRDEPRADGATFAKRTCAPLYFQRHGPFRVGYILGAGPIPTRGMGLADRTDLFVGPPRPGALAGALAGERWDLLWLRALPEDSPSVPGFSAAARERGWGVKVRFRSYSPYIELPRRWEAYLGARSPGARYEYRGHRRKLEKAGRLEIAHLAGPQPETERLLAELRRVDAASWKARTGTGLLLPPHLRAFMGDVIRVLLPARLLEIATLRLDGELLAYNLCYLKAEAVGNYSNSFRDSYRRFSPGTVLLAENIRWALENGYREYDLMRGSAAYKDWWATSRRTEVDLIITRPTARSRLAAALLVETRARLKASPAVLRLRDWYLRAREGV